MTSVVKYTYISVLIISKMSCKICDMSHVILAKNQVLCIPTANTGRLIHMPTGERGEYWHLFFSTLSTGSIHIIIKVPDSYFISCVFNY